jgi:hypothetical protein
MSIKIVLLTALDASEWRKWASPQALLGAVFLTGTWDCNMNRLAGTYPQQSGQPAHSPGRRSQRQLTQRGPESPRCHTPARQICPEGSLYARSMPRGARNVELGPRFDWRGQDEYSEQSVCKQCKSHARSPSSFNLEGDHARGSSPHLMDSCMQQTSTCAMQKVGTSRPCSQHTAAVLWSNEL